MRGPEDQGRKRWGQAGRGGGTGRWELTLQIQPQASWSEASLRAEGKAKEHTLAGKQSKGRRRPGPAFAIGSWFGWPGAGLRGF